MRSRNYFGYPLSVTLMLMLISLCGLLAPAPLVRMQDIVFDYYQRWVAQQGRYNSSVAVVVVDERSLAAVGQWPWPRHVLADLTRKLQEAGASVIAFDFLFSESDQSSPEILLQNLPDSEERRILALKMAAMNVSHDQAFASAIEKAPVVLGFIAGDRGRDLTVKSGYASAGDNPVDFVPRFKAAVPPIPLLTQGARGVGAVNWFPEDDNVVRRVPTIIAVDGQLASSLALEAIRVASGADTIVVRSSNASGQTAFGTATGINAVRVGDIIINTEPDGQVRLFARPSDPSSWISASAVLEGRFSKNEVKGKIVFIGAAALGLRDQRATSVSNTIPGVEIHAQITEQIMAGISIVRTDWIRGLEAAVTALAGIFMALLLRLIRIYPFLSILTGLSAPIIIVVGSWTIFTQFGVLVDAIMPSMGVLSAFVTAMAYNYRESEGRRTEVRNMFGRFVPPAVVERLVSTPEKITLGGEIRTLSIMFSDVRNFTALAEVRTPQEVVSLLRSIHTPSVTSILKHNGTIDKFIGDGLMAFWNAPVDMPDHPLLACKAALDIINASRNFTDPPIRLGIGIHSGNACVGNLGSEQRLEYSALGDAVNIASRVETLTKVYGVEVLVTDTIRRDALDMPFLEIDRVIVRGRKTPISLFSLYPAMVDQRFLNLQAIQNKFLTLYRSGEFNRALMFLDTNINAYAPFYTELVNYYRNRLIDLRRNPPANWRGISYV